MGNESWTIVQIDEEWADLRQGEYVYCVPVSQLPQGATEGDRVRAPSSSGSGVTRWVSDETRARSA